MNRREAKREACFIAASALDASMASWEDYNGIDPCSADGHRVTAALQELVEELRRRAWVGGDPPGLLRAPEEAP